MFLLTFEDGVELAARFPYPEEYRKVRTKCEVSTMLYARQVLSLPVPRVYAWSVNEGTESPVGAPFILMEQLPGCTIGRGEWLVKDEKDRLATLRSLAKLHSKIIAPLPPSVQHIGRLQLRDFPETCLSWSDDKIPQDNFEIIPLIPCRDALNIPGRDFHPNVSGTFPSIVEHWLAVVQEEFLEVKRRCAILNKDSTHVFPAHVRLDDVHHTVEAFVDAYRNLMTLIGHYARTYPSSHPSQRICLWNHDFSLKNIIFDPETFEVKGIIGWGNASIVPLALSARYPEELEQTNRPNGPCPSWKYYSKNVTLIEPGESNSPEELSKTWYRFYYSGVAAETDVTLSSNYWEDSELALKLHELVESGFVQWMSVKEWLEVRAAGLVQWDGRDGSDGKLGD